MDGLLMVVAVLLFSAQTEGDVGYNDYDAAYDLYDGIDGIAPEPKFDVPVVNVTVVAKQTALLPCSIDHLGNYKVTWTDNRGVALTLEDRRVVDDPRFSVLRPHSREWHLQIRDVKYEDRGRYMCTVNTNPPRHKQVAFHVNVPPWIFDAGSSDDTTVKEGETVILICNATGVPQPTVKWYRSPANSHREYEPNMQIIELTGEMLLLHNVSRHCDDLYECVADNGVPPQDSRKIRVTVEFEPEVHLQNAAIGQVVGKDTILVCIITASPHSQSHWEKNGKIISTNSKYKVETYTIDEHVVHLNLQIREVSKDDYGHYTCVASNYLGKSEAVMKLYEVDATQSVTVKTPQRNGPSVKAVTPGRFQPSGGVHVAPDTGNTQSQQQQTDSYKVEPRDKPRVLPSNGATDLSLCAALVVTYSVFTMFNCRS